MKNCKSFPHRFPLLRHGKLLMLAALFFFSSCRKDNDLPVPETGPAGPASAVSSERSSGLESQVVEYTQWMLNKLVPVVSDPAVYEDIKAGNYSSSQVQAKMVDLGFINFTDFAGKLRAKGSTVNAALNSGALTKEAVADILAKYMNEIDFGVLGRSGGVPGAPCYNEMMSSMAFIMMAGAAAAVEAPPAAAAATIATIIALGAAVANFYNCLDENYPNG